MKTKTYDLTRGPVFRTMTLFAIPMLLGNMMQQAYNIVDTWVVGKYIGASALAAVGSAYSLMTFLTSILIGLCMGSGILFSMCFGRKAEGELEQNIGTSFAMILGVALLLTVLPMAGLDRIIEWLNIPQEVTSPIREYLWVIFLGIPAVFLYNFFSAYLKAVGNSFLPLLFLGISTGTNILLDLWFVAGLSWGVRGAAVATIAAQYLSGGAMAGYVLFTSQTVRNGLRQIRLRQEHLGEIGRYSFFTCLQQSVMNLGILAVQGIVNRFGVTIMAAFAAAVKIDSFAYMPAQEYANAFSTFTAQNVGAGDEARVKKGIRCALISSLGYCALASLVLWTFAESLMKIFVDAGEQEILREGVRYLRIEGAFYCGIGVLFLLYALYRAIGMPQMSLVLTVISLGTRVMLAYVLSPIPRIGVCGIWWAIPIGWGLADAAGGLYYWRISKKKHGTIANRGGRP